MFLILKEKILDNGNFQLNTVRMRENELGDENVSCLDISFSTEPTKISNHNTIFPTFSDHTLVILNRSSKRMETHKRYRKAREF